MAEPGFAAENPVRRSAGNPVFRGIATLCFLSTGWVFPLPASEPSAGGRDWWAYQPVSRPEPPNLAESARIQSPVDRFIFAKLESEGLSPNPPADRRTLFRRASFDLLGLPPSPEQATAFAHDPSPTAWNKAIEGMLASPRYGERWGRRWMDVARYADTAGDNADYPVPELYRYRDYIIDAWNDGLPFDEFIREQLAGDILALQAPGPRYAEQIAATGFLALSRRYGTGPYELWHLTLENTLETVGQAFLGLNLKCARCHDHKSDPVTALDYYGLYGIFASTTFPWAGSEEVHSKNLNRQNFVSLLTEAETAVQVQAWRTRLEELEREIQSLEQRAAEGESGATDRLTSARQTLRTLTKPGVPPGLPAAYAVGEGPPQDVAMQLWGDPASPGPSAPRCPPRFLTEILPWTPPGNSSGRLAFSEWLTLPQHPLTPRVIVNRIWAHHFGQGLVSNPNHFGRGGTEPAHRELLDYLTTRFLESGWSIKDLHRLILRSAVYQLSSSDNPDNSLRDPQNHLHWRYPRRRLDAESLRDSLLELAGNLDLSRPGPHPFPSAEQWTWTQHTPFQDVYPSHHRSVYLMTQRFQRHPFLALFDGPDTNVSIGTRSSSTTPQQALFFLNDTFFENQAQDFARRICSLPCDDAARIADLFQRAWARLPGEEECQRSLGWLAEARRRATLAGIPETARELAVWTSLTRTMLQSNAFVYVD